MLWFLNGDKHIDVIITANYKRFSLFGSYAISLLASVTQLPSAVLSYVSLHKVKIQLTVFLSC